MDHVSRVKVKVRVLIIRLPSNTLVKGDKHLNIKAYKCQRIFFSKFRKIGQG